MADNKRTIKFEIKVDADAKGADRFARVLKELESSAPIADRELRKVRKGILDFVQATGASERSTKAAETALRTLQGEAKAGGTLWRQLTKDISDLKSKLGEATGALKTAAQAKKEFDSALSAPVGSTFAKLGEQTSFLNGQLQQLNYRTKEYTRTLVRVKELEGVGNFYSGRQNVIAANQAYMGATMARTYENGRFMSGLPALPDTLAGDSQRVSELTQRIQNLDRGSEQYLQTVKELTAAQIRLASAQNQLNRAVDEAGAGLDRVARRERRQGKQDAIASYYSSGTLGGSGNTNVAQRRDDGFGGVPQSGIRSDGTFVAPPYRTGNYTRMGDAGLGQFGPETPQDYRRRVEPLIAAVESSNDQLIQARRNAAVRAAEQDARIAQFKNEQADQLTRQVIAAENARFESEIRDFDTRLKNREKKREQSLRAAEQRRRQLREYGGIATAVGVGGFFGGPEGGAGAAIGAVFGGAGGAQAGATIGLGLASGRQFVAGMATQAAELSKLRIALRSVVASQAEYEASIRIVDKANRELNIPLVQGTRQFTQLAAAVIGAGGTVTDAALAFNAVNSAIKATGGNTQDADGALRAIVQTFSKGKVSAEELRGQLAERLPGAVTLFAASIGKTGPELDKALEKGQVGLNDFIKFLSRLDKDFSETARKIAASGDEAGTRLQLRWESTALAIGNAFKPLGESIQNDLAKYLQQNEAAITRWARTFADSIAFVGDRLGKLFNLFGKADGLLRQLKNGGGPFNFFQQQDIEKNLAGFSTESFWKQIGGNAQNRSQIESQLNEVKQSIKDLQATRKGIWFPQIARDQVKLLDAQILQQQLKQARLEAGLRALPAEKPGALSTFADPAAKGDDSAAKKAEREAERQRRIAEQLAAERQRLLEAQTQQEIRLADMVYRHKVELDNRRYENQRELDNLRARAEIAALNPQARDVASMFAQFSQSRAEGADRIRRLEQELEASRLALANAKRMAAVTAMAPQVGSTAMPAVMTGGRSSGMIARTGSTGDSTGPHLDARWADRRPITAADVDRYLRVNGRAPSSFGVTSGYGPRNLFGRSFHAGIDFGTPSGSGITLQNGAELLRDLGFTGAGGYAVEIDTPQGRMRLLHLQRDSASAPSAATASTGGLRRTPAGVAAQERRNTVDMGDTAAAALQVRQSEEALRTEKLQEAARAQAQWNALVAESTQQLRDSTLATQDNIQQLQDRTRYTLEGFKPEQIEGMVQVNQLQREQTRIMEQLGVEQARAIAENNPERLKQVNDLILERANAYNANVAALQQLTVAQTATNEALRQFEARKNLIQGIGSTLFNGINSAITSIVSGTREWGQALREIASSVLQDIGQQLVSFGLRSLLGGINVGGFSLFGGAFAEGGRPPLGKVSVVGEKGPELFVPDTAGTIIPNYKLAAALAPSQPMAPSGPIDVNVQTQVINGVEYATVDQLRAATKQAAERGQALALNSLQRSTRMRKKVGV